jgi:hypothetical protein
MELMTSPATGIARVSLASLLCLAQAGCVERILKIRTDPPGAIVLVNDEQAGVTPLKVSFLWYGDYDLIFRKEGYQTLKTSYRVDAPWYQWPPFDLIAETLVPGTIRDERELPTFVLAPAEPPAVGEVVERAVEMRDRALYEGP